MYKIGRLETFTEQDIDPSHIWRWCWERRGAEGEEGVRGWDGWMVAPVRWTWTGANSGRWWGTGGPGVLPSMGSQSQTRLGNWATATCNNSPWFWNPALQSSSPSPSTLYLGQQISSSKNSGCDTSAPSLRDVAPTISDTWRKDGWERCHSTFLQSESKFPNGVAHGCLYINARFYKAELNILRLSFWKQNNQSGKTNWSDPMISLTRLEARVLTGNFCSHAVSQKNSRNSATC